MLINNRYYHLLFYKIFRFKWRNPFITLSKILYKGKDCKRVLGIWDFENGRTVIGDAIEFQEILLVVAEENKIDKIDCCYVNPSVRNFKKNRYQVTDLKTIDNIIAVTRINPKIGSVFIFDNNDQFSNYFRKEKHNYIIFPNPYIPFAALSNNYHLIDFFNRYHYLPKLTSDRPHLEWANTFIEKHCKDKTPFCVAIRKNRRDPDRNAPVEEWAKFFKYCNLKYPDFFFIIIGSEQEIHPELLEMKNILFAKLYDSSLLQDIAIIQSSKVLLAHSSGLSVFPYYIENVPSISFGEDVSHNHWGTGHKKGEQLNYTKENHKILWGSYNSGDIIKEFDELINNFF